MMTIGVAFIPSADAKLASVSGRVVNQTTGAPAAGVVVTVVQLGADRQEKRRQVATTDADGMFTAEGFDQIDTDTFVAGAEYLGVTYSAAVKMGEAVDLRVHETTKNDDVIKITSDTLSVVRGSEDTMEVLQLMRIVNTSNTTYVGEGDSVLTLPVPEGAFDLAAGEGIDEQRLARAKQGAQTMDPLLPGELTITYAYKVKVARGGWSLRRPVVYPTDRIDVLVGDGLVLDAQLEFQETKKIGNITYKRYRGGPFKPGAFLGVDIRYVQPDSSSLFQGLAILLSALALVVVLGTFVMRKKRSPRAVRATPLSRQELIEQIAILDERFANENIDEAEYRDIRAKKMTQLEQMTVRR